MFEVTKLIRFADGVDESERETVLSGVASDVLPHARSALIRPTLPGGIAAGDVIARSGSTSNPIGGQLRTTSSDACGPQRSSTWIP